MLPEANQVLEKKSNNRSYTRYHSKDSLLSIGVNFVLFEFMLYLANLDAMFETNVHVINSF